MSLAFACLLALCAEPSVTLPRDLTAKPGRLLKIEANTTGKSIRWVNVSEDADLIVSESGKWAIFSATAPGKYRVFAWTAFQDIPSEAAVCTITVEPSQPVPPPSPEDSLKAAVQAIYGADTNPQKSVHKDNLISSYGEFARTIRNPKWTTAGEFYKACRATISSLMRDEDLQAIREKFGEELNRRLPTDPGTLLTDTHRADAVSLFTRFAKLLGEIQ